MRGGGRVGVILGETAPFGLSDIGKSLGLEAITKAVTKLSEWLNFRTGKRSLDAFSIVHRRPRDGNSIIIRQPGLMLEADGTTFRFYGLAPATATINFPPVDVSTYHRVFKEEKLFFPFLSFSREGNRPRVDGSWRVVWLRYWPLLDIPPEITRRISISGEYKWMERREIEFERISLRIVGMARRW